MAAGIQSHLRKAGLPMPVSWVLISFSSSGAAAKSCDRHASQPACLWAGALRGPDYSTRASFSANSPGMQDAGHQGFCSHLLPLLPSPRSVCIGGSMKAKSQPFSSADLPCPRGDLAGRMAPPEFFHLEPCCPHSVWPGARSVPICSNTARASLLSFPLEASISFYHPGFYGPW